MLSALINADELHENIDNTDWLVVDCQYNLMDKDAGHTAYRTAHIPGAVYVRLDTQLSQHDAVSGGRHPLPDAAQLQNVFSDLGIGKQTQVIAYDASAGSFAARLWWLLAYAGHKNVAVLDGGLQAWQQAGYLTESSDVPKCGKHHFQVQLKQELVVKPDEVLQCELLIDSREEQRYRGEKEPLDPIAGHIPGAVNRCWQQNLTETGKFKPADILANELSAVFAHTRPEDAVFYCGSGVSACHNLLAAVYAGFALPRLYAGSWSEWCEDPGRPVAKG